MYKPRLYFLLILFSLSLAITQVSCSAPPAIPHAATQAQPVESTQTIAIPKETVTSLPTFPPLPTAPVSATLLPTPSLAAHTSFTLTAPQGALARLGKGQINTFALSADGNLLAVASTAGIFVFQASSLAEMWGVATSTQAIDVAFSPDSLFLAAVLDRSPALLWEAASGKQVYTLEPPPATGPSLDLRMTRLAFSPDGGVLAAATRSGSILLWDAVRGEPLPILEDSAGGEFTCLAFAPDGRILVSARGSSNKLKLWDLSLAQKLGEINIELDGVVDLAFSPNGSTLAVLAASASQRKIFLWEAAALLKPGMDLKPRQSISAEGALSLAFSPDGSTLVAGSRNAIHIWASVSGDLKREVDISQSPYPVFVSRLAFMPDGKLLFALETDGSDRGPLAAWDLAREKIVLNLQGFTQPVSSLAFSPDGRFLASGYGTSRASILLWEITPEAITAKIPPERLTIPDQDSVTQVTSLAFSPDGKTLAAGAGGTIYLWDLTVGSGEASARLEGAVKGTVFFLAFSPDGESLVAAYQTAGDSLIVWDLASLKEAHLLPVSNASHISFSPHTSLFAVGSGGGGSVTVWDLASGDLRLSLYGSRTGILDIAYTQDGNTLAAIYNNGKAFQWEAPGGKLLQEINITATGDTGPLSQAVFSPDGSILASATEIGETLFDMKTGHILSSFHGHTGAITYLAFSSDGSLLASGSADGTVILWEVGNQP